MLSVAVLEPLFDISDGGIYEWVSKGNSRFYLSSLVLFFHELSLYLHTRRGLESNIICYKRRTPVILPGAYLYLEAMWSPVSVK